MIASPYVRSNSVMKAGALAQPLTVVYRIGELFRPRREKSIRKILPCQEFSSLLTPCDRL